MVKSYLKYELSQSFGLINSGSSNVIWVPEDDTQNNTSRSTGAGRAITAANEEVFVWDVKKGELLSRWKDNECTDQVTAISQSRADRDVFAVGYEDGSIRVWDSKIPTVILKFNGHRSAITVLEFDRSGTRIASGAKDTDLIVWDLITETGLFKLRGHKDQMTGLHFVSPMDPQTSKLSNGETETDQSSSDGQETFLLTTSKDSLVKLWDLSSRHCIETHVAQSNGECWALGVMPDEAGFVTAGNDGEIKVWALDSEGLSNSTRSVKGAPNQKYIQARGTLYRQGRDRPINISFHSKANFLLVHGSEKAVELWRMRSEGEVQKSLARKRKRRREKAKASKEQNGTGGDVEMEDAQGDDDDISTAEVSDIFVSYVVVRTGGKVRAVDWAGRRSHKHLQLLVATANNQVELFNVDNKDSSKKKSKSDDAPEYNRSYSVELPGHKTDVRALSLSSDDRMLASASNGSLKVWNVRTETCIRTFECGYALCCAFLPGDKIAAVGTKSGDLELFDVSSSTVIETIKAHEGSTWTLQVHPDGKSITTGGGDKSVKFWNFQIAQEEIPGTKRTAPRLRLVHTRTMKVTDDILSLRFSPDARLLAVSLLDNTVKVFFVDSLKLYLNLYGHKLPVLNMDISHDSKLLVTCSADKNVRIWGLDFGDCHKALFAHQDSIMAVAFVPQSSFSNRPTETGHYFFSASKDGTIKYWDGDKFEQIQKLQGHHGEIWALALSRTGDFVVSASHDKSIRIWSQTDEPLFLEEERERELEELYESTLTTSLEEQTQDATDGEAANGEGGAGGTSTAAGKQTVETLKAGERIAEALEIGMADLEVVRTHAAAQQRYPNRTLAPPQRNPIFLALGPDTTAESYVLSTLQRIPAAALHDALLVIPFNSVPPLFTFLELFAAQGLNIPLTCRVLFFMLRTHHAQIVASRTMRPMLERVRSSLRTALTQQKDTFGFNLAGLRVLGSRVNERVGARGLVEAFEADESVDDLGKGKRKRGFISLA